MQSTETASWPAQLFVLHGESQDELLGRCVWLQQQLDAGEMTGAEFHALAADLGQCVHPGGLRVAFVAADQEELSKRVRRAIERLSDPKCAQIRDVGGIYFTSEPLYRDPDDRVDGVGKVAILYPGEGAQYLGMLGDMLELPAIRDCFAASSEAIVAEHSGAMAPSAFLAVPDDAEQREQLEAELKKLDNAMLTVLVADWSLTLTLQSMGVPCDAMAGHSAGELAALMMTGAMEADEAVGKLVTSLSELESAPGVDASLLAIGASRETVEGLLSDYVAGGHPGSPPELAMDNCPHQTVVVGESAAMEGFEALIGQRSLMYERLELARPYHTSLFQPMMAPLYKMFEAATFRTPEIPVYSCTTGGLFPDDPDAIRSLCISHWRERVEFVRMIRQMHEDGVRVFIEAGPRGNLTSFVDDILRNEAHVALPANLPRRNGLAQLIHLSAQLIVQGVPMDVGFFLPSDFCPNGDADVDDAGHAARADVAGNGMATSQHASVGLELELGHAPPVEPKSAVMRQYFQVMEDFLATQQGVMTEYLAGNPGDGHASFEGGVHGAHANPGDVSVAPVLGAEEPTLGSDMALFQPDGVNPMTRPMLGEFTEYVANESLVMRRVLDVEEDVYADHHTVGGRSISRVDPHQHGLPIMPLTFTVEIMAEVGQALLPDLVVRQVKNIQLMRWLAFYEGDPGEIEVTARKLDPDEGDLERQESRVLIQIRNLGTVNNPDPKRLVSAVGTVVLGPTMVEPDCELAPFEIPGARPCTVTLEEMYNNLFHGEQFQGTRRLTVIGDDGIEGEIQTLPREDAFRSLDDPQFIGDPVVMDVAMHPPVAWHLTEPDQSGRILLPFELEKMEYFGRRPPANHPMVSQTRIVETTIRHFAHVTEIFDAVTGKIWARINKVKLWRFYFPFRDVNFHGPKDVYFISTRWDEALPPAAAEQVTIARMEPLEDLKGPALLSAAARVMMSPREFDIFENLDRPLDKKPEYLFGRIAAKDAVRYHQRRMQNQRLFLADVEIDSDESGRPIASPRGQQRPDDFPNISISHCSGIICAAASSARWVGVDVERIEDRESSFERIAFSSRERALLDQTSDPESRAEWATRFWCAKEAVAKALGEGLTEGTHSLAVTSVGDGAEANQELHVTLGPELAAKFPEHGDKPMIVWTRREGEYVSAVSLCWRRQQADADTLSRA